ncbi:hypothetical protein ACH437_09030 [Streptomyces xinghaiensis]|uniref:hypothetical protein n=1 Tax=Streptomyces xinghaiensis TaxID=1038928 RepID=UPI0037B45F35
MPGQRAMLLPVTAPACDVEEVIEDGGRDAERGQEPPDLPGCEGCGLPLVRPGRSQCAACRKAGQGEAAS